MKKRFSRVLALTALILTFALVATPMGTVFANFADGTYSVPYEMKENSSDSTSIADGYFTSPATVTVKDGVQTVQLTVTGADMIKDLSTSSGPVNVVSESGDTRTVSFQVSGDLSQPVSMDMHIVVPDLYDTTHTARAVFDVSGIPAAGAGDSGDSSDNEAATTVENPPTGDNTPIALYVTLLLGSIAIFTIYKVRTARN